MSWGSGIAWVALIFSAVCFVLFVMEAIKRPPPEQVAEQVTRHMASQVKSAKMASDSAPLLDPRILGELAKALADAFSKIGPGLVALIGALLFLLLSGEAVGVYNLTGSASENSTTPDSDTGNDQEGEEGNGSEANESGNGSDPNASENSA